MKKKTFYLNSDCADVFLQRGKDRKAVEMGEMRTWSCSVSAAPAGFV